MNQSTRTKWDALSRRSVGAALRAWRDLPKLGQHPLARLDIVEHYHQQANYRDGTGGYGLALQKVLRDTIELLRPAPGQPRYDDRRWFPYLILFEQDVKGHSRLALMAELGENGLPERTYDNYRAEALDRLVNLLRERELEFSRQPIGPAAARQFDHVEWGDAPQTIDFQGRQAELAEIEYTLISGEKSVIGLVGLGGIGKTALAAELVRQVAPRFQRVIWRSARNAPPLFDLLGDYLYGVLDQPAELPATLADRQALLLTGLRQRRCLLVLDNVETILRAGQSAAAYRSGYAEYGEWLRQIMSIASTSCLLITSRELPPELIDLPNAAHRWSLNGLSIPECQQLLAGWSLTGDDAAWTTLVARYSGNPLALQLVAHSIRDLFGCDLARFLRDGAAIFGDVRALLDQQFERLSPLERDSLYWLAIEREPADLDRLQSDLNAPASRRDLLESLAALRRRSLIESTIDAFTLPNLMLEHVTDRLVDRINQEVVAGSIELWNSHALLQASAADAVRRTQARLIVKPVIDYLSRCWRDSEQFKDRLLALSRSQSGYAMGNALNVLLQAGVPVRGADFSDQVIRSAYLVDADLREADFSRAELIDCRLAEGLDSVNAVVFSHDGRWLAAGTTANHIHLWRLPTGQLTRVLRGHTSIVRSLAFSPDDGTLVSASSDHTVRVWDVLTGECRLTLTDHTHRVRTVRITADGARCLSGSSDQTLREWDVTTGELLRTRHAHTASVWALALSPDERWLVSGDHAGQLIVWDLASDSIRAAWPAHTACIRSIAFSPDGRSFATGGEDNMVRVWDVSTLTCQQELPGHSKWVYAVTYSPDGARLVSAGEDGTVRVWQSATGRCLHILRGHANSVEALAFSPDGRVLASGGNDQSVQWWEPISGQRLRQFSGAGNTPWTLAFSRDGRWLYSGDSDDLAQRWSLETSQRGPVYRGHRSWVQAVAVSPNGALLATGSSDLTVKLWETVSGRCRSTLYGHTAWLCAVAFSPDGTLLASASEDATVRVWNVASSGCVALLTDFTNSVRDVTFSRDGQRLLASGDEGAVIVWDTATWQPVLITRDHATVVWVARFSPDGELIITGDESGLVEVRHAASGQQVRTLPQNLGRAWTLDVHPNGEWVATSGGDEVVRVWDIHTSQFVRALTGHTGALRYVAISPDGRFLASAADDQTIRLWNVHTGECVKVLRVERPYEGLQITGVRGLSEVQCLALKALGAVDL